MKTKKRVRRWRCLHCGRKPAMRWLKCPWCRMAKSYSYP